ncbi:hypothetical protein [Micromonospora echinofusca]|uniref:Uncharacterized protein n=1 Tax=Micromonospora echinofusca TaxID=47858 RepID=A0ABS3VQT2_MICEH|nr:hypothetical protein [Micromonospora echinofusca]MBO4206865.1 hypothetical protein [Micromonospora echinofusca]
MAVRAGTAAVRAAAVREILFVLLMGVGGLLLALLAAFAPWYPAPTGRRPAAVVDLNSPAEPAPGNGLTAADMVGGPSRAPGTAS